MTIYSSRNFKGPFESSFIFIILILFLFSPSLTAADETIAKPVHKKTSINDPVAATKLEGSHLLALQWISWDYFGKVEITRSEINPWQIAGRQDSRDNDDFLELDGIITEINTRDFTFVGKITTRVSFINEGNPVVRNGKMSFRISGKRQYWRLREKQNPKDIAVDYVDIFFKRTDKGAQKTQKRLD